MSLTKPNIIFSISVKKNLFVPTKKISWKTNRLNGVAVLPFISLFGPNVLIHSAGRIKRLVELDFDVKHSIILDARHRFVKLFLRYTHVKNHHQGIDYLRSKVQERYAIFKLRSSLRTIESNFVLRGKPFNQSWRSSQRRLAY